jgi:hypothetical protein
LFMRIHIYLIWNSYPPRLTLEGVPNLAIRISFNPVGPAKPKLPFTTSVIHDAINASIWPLYEGTPVHFKGHYHLRPASRDKVR